MRLFSMLLPITITAAAQGNPPHITSRCDVPDGAPLALITGTGAVDMWHLDLPPAQNLPVKAGQPVYVGNREGDWTCIGGFGSGYGWAPAARLAPIAVDPNPPRASWIGTWVPYGWKNQDPKTSSKLVIAAGPANGLLQVQGRKFWFGPVVGGERVLHRGGVAGVELSPLHLQRSEEH